MYTVKEISVLIDSLEKNLEAMRETANSNRPMNDKYNSCIHIRNGMFVASVWNSVFGYNDKRSYSTVEYNDIISGEDVYLEQDEFCQTVQRYLCKINNI